MCAIRSLNILKEAIQVFLKQFYQSKHYLSKKLCMRESVCAQSCPTLCDPMDCSLPGSSVHEIFQGGVLEWVTIAFSGPVLPSSALLKRRYGFLSCSIYLALSIVYGITFLEYLD